MIDLKKVKKIHFIGIGGIGISAVARMMILEGKKITANDTDEFELVAALRKFGVDTKITTDPSAIPKDTELVIYSIAWNKIAPQLMEYVKSTGVPTLSYPEAIGLISKDKYTIAVAGTHGKTTTTAMIAQILIEAGLDPTVIVGSLLKNQKSNFIAGSSKYFVVEACEYKRSFLNLQPQIAVITNIDDDHLDYYKNFAGVQEGFKDFAKLVKKDGAIVTDADNEKIKPILTGLRTKIVDYKKVDQKIGSKINLKIPGLHNIQNAKAALSVAKIIGVPEEKALRALANFSGTWRRFEEKGQTKSSALVYDDYAHHPSEIKATLQAAKEKFPKQKIIVAFQPHLYSRTKEHLEEFGEVFANADEILLLPIYAAREPKDPTISSEILTEKLRKAGRNAKFFPDFEAAGQYLAENLAAKDVFFTMGAGDINKLGEIVLS